MQAPFQETRSRDPAHTKTMKTIHACKAHCSMQHASRTHSRGVNHASSSPKSHVCPAAACMHLIYRWWHNESLHKLEAPGHSASTGTAAEAGRRIAHGELYTAGCRKQGLKATHRTPWSARGRPVRLRQLDQLIDSILDGAIVGLSLISFFLPCSLKSNVHSWRSDMRCSAQK